MLKTCRILSALLIVYGTALAQDQFDGIRCGADVPRALTGKHDSNQRVAVLEERHKDLGLKDLGGTELSDRLFLGSWQICGGEYELLVNTKSGVIRDVLPFPQHSRAMPMFIGTCQANGKEVPGTVIAVLDNSSGHNPRDAKLAGTKLKATSAWNADVTKEKFAKQSVEQLECPLEGIVTQDGGS